MLRLTDYEDYRYKKNNINQPQEISLVSPLVRFSPINWLILNFICHRDLTSSALKSFTSDLNL